MRDPHVEYLRYNIRHSEHVTYKDPDPIEKDLGAFIARLADGILTCMLNQHFTTVEDARAAVDPVLRAWEIDAALRHGHGEFGFEYERANVIDRNPVPGPATLQMDSAFQVQIAGTVTLYVTRNQYPDPPERFAVSPDLETLWSRYQGHLEGKEPLLSVGYFILTVLQSMAGSRKAAAKALNIDLAVLNKLGELTSNRGDGKTARKMPSAGAPAPLKTEEERWIQRLLPKLVRRTGELAGNGVGDRITMIDLPPL